MKTIPNIHRINGIDFLRGLSILAVILLHINIRVPLEKSFIGQWLPLSVSKVLLWSGYYGVIIFFVISGFLITLSSIKRWGSLQNIRYDQFYLIRFARIMPCLIGLVLILSVLDMAKIQGFVIDPHNTSLGRAIFSAFTFHLNWLEAKTGYLPGGWDVLWSLSVEEAFYLFFPLICRLVKSELKFIFLMITFVVIGPFARTVFSTNDIWLDHSYFSCMDGIALGCLAALLTSKVNITKKYLHLLMTTGITLTVFIMVFKKQVFDLGLTSVSLNVTILEIGIALLAIALYKKSLNESPQKNRLFMMVEWYGRNSYEIYLTHMFFIIFLVQIFESTHQAFNLAPLWYVAIILASGFGGHLIARYYSEPINKSLRKKLLNHLEHHPAKSNNEFLLKNRLTL